MGVSQAQKAKESRGEMGTRSYPLRSLCPQNFLFSRPMYLGSHKDSIITVGVVSIRL